MCINRHWSRDALQTLLCAFMCFKGGVALEKLNLNFVVTANDNKGNE